MTGLSGALTRAWALVAAIAGPGAAQAAPDPQQPVMANFVEAIRRELDTQPLMARTVFGPPVPALGPACVRLLIDNMRPESRSRLQRYGWHADFLKDTSSRPERAQQFAALDALVAVGLLRRDESAVSVGAAAPEAAWRYRLTPTGWAQYDDFRHCFPLGKRTLLEGLDSTPVQRAGETLYLVKARIGTAAASALPAWARDERVQRAFLEIGAELQGQVQTLALRWRDGRWHAYGSTAGLNAAPLPPLPPELQRREAALASRPPPSRQELETLIKDFPAQSCLPLPGSEKLPADKVFDDRRRYRVGFYLDAAGQPRTPGASKTLSVVERLAATGGMVRLPDAPVAGAGADKGKLSIATVYALAPQLQALVVDGCLSLGPLTFQTLDLQLQPPRMPGWAASSFTFKRLASLRQPPKALTDAVLLATWPDLRGILENGYACSGQYDFNPETREAAGGAQTCWYAFDSQYENY